MKHKEKIPHLGIESQDIHTVCLRSIAITAVKLENKEISTNILRNIPFLIVALGMAHTANAILYHFINMYFSMLFYTICSYPHLSNTEFKTEFCSLSSCSIICISLITTAHTFRVSRSHSEGC